MVLPNSVRMRVRVSVLLSHFSWKAAALKLCSDALKILSTFLGLLTVLRRNSACSKLINKFLGL